MTEPNYALEQAKAQYESLCGMIAALEVDYDRLFELKDLEEGDTTDPAEHAEFVELLSRADGCEDRDVASIRIQEDPLSVMVRSGWATPGDALNAEDFEILLCTGGPAVRIRGELDPDGQPYRAWLEYQDWGTPWTRFYEAEQDMLLAYCREFCFGG